MNSSLLLRPDHDNTLGRTLGGIEISEKIEFFGSSQNPLKSLFQHFPKQEKSPKMGDTDKEANKQYRVLQ